MTHLAIGDPPVGDMRYQSTRQRFATRAAAISFAIRV